ncbi:PLP-dependent aspartate aminotransferase family protein [Jeotgalicoccus sp. ATCC 8456]|uniref:trans-sulfuration enzyme family protein n=1 Tax=Jeotgalicoccus sp. ATCC 8456 TaxID=946435 RepID=UPI0018E62176|nr:PLP-dependent aspartate aminotransferase family protein [Jeotgalicoccus sp. ATCC 8456]QQD84425.1 PLP-dependent transferase [Jeotgalicoccus sp. ATCC 8456]
MHFETKAIHVGRSVDPNTGAVTAPIHLSSTYERQADGGYINETMYSRSKNPNRRSLEECLTALENGYDAIAFSSGMAAITAVIESLPKKYPKRIVLPNEMYFGVKLLIEKTDIGQRFDIVTIDMTDGDALKTAINEKPTGIVWIESPSNPQINITDIKKVVSLAQGVGAITVVDNTTASPVFQQQLDLGADFSLHSVTKYIGGHSDVLLGAVIAKESSEMLENMRLHQANKGGVPSPFECWLALRGIETLSLRVHAHAKNALDVALFLESHNKVKAVHYPGLNNHPSHDIAKGQMSGFGGLLSFEVEGGSDDALKVANSVEMIVQATSLGSTHSYIEHRASVEKELTISPDNLLRLSVGLENVEDIKADLNQALEQI